MLQPGTTLSDQYQIEAVIGEGAFGRVYRARDLQLSRPVAVKELRKAPGEHGSSDYARFAERFRRARSTSSASSERGHDLPPHLDAHNEPSVGRNGLPAREGVQSCGGGTAAEPCPATFQPITLRRGKVKR